MDRKEYLKLLDRQYFDICKQLKEYGFSQLIQYGRDFFLEKSSYSISESVKWTIGRVSFDGEVILTTNTGGALSTSKEFVENHCYFAPDVEFLLLALPAQTEVRKRDIKGDDGLFSDIEFCCKCGTTETSGLSVVIALAKLWLKLNNGNE